MNKLEFAAKSLCLVIAVSINTASAQDTYTAATTTRVSRGTHAGAAEPNGAASNPVMSKNSRFVVFTSAATNIHNTGQTNFTGVVSGTQCYLFDRQSNTVELVSITSPDSDDGARVLPVNCSNPT